MQQSDRFIGPLIQLAPRVLVMASEVQLVLGLYEALSSVIKGDRVEMYKTILNLIRSKLSPSQCDTIVNCMKTAVSVIEFADSIKDVLKQIVELHNSTTKGVQSDNSSTLSYPYSLRDLINHEALRAEKASHEQESVEVIVIRRPSTSRISSNEYDRIPSYIHSYGRVQTNTPCNYRYCSSYDADLRRILAIADKVVSEVSRY